MATDQCILCLLSDMHSGNIFYAGHNGFAYPYKEGPPCGDCPDACDNGLCSKPYLMLSTNNHSISLSKNNVEI